MIGVSQADAWLQWQVLKLQIHLFEFYGVPTATLHAAKVNPCTLVPKPPIRNTDGRRGKGDGASLTLQKAKSLKFKSTSCNGRSIWWCCCSPAKRHGCLCCTGAVYCCIATVCCGFCCAAAGSSKDFSRNAQRRYIFPFCGGRIAEAAAAAAAALRRQRG